jgi:type II secretory pathway pseudopilin PulG
MSFKRSIGVGLERLKRRLATTSGFSLLELVMTIIFTSITMPALASMFMQAIENSPKAEFMMVANMLAQEQVEIIIADKAGSPVASGFGYSNITSAKYASVQPPSPYNSWGRTVTITTVNMGGSASYPAKVITVTVTHAKMRPVVLTCCITDHSGL